ncbi:hypothetical protein [Herpetosiphon sp. NSE202]|uniref:hypothetical protein n=1 Tax=Herpetosiphon sp. NSE202 TaxID=3351349 RepID=UPI0036389D55
MGIRLHFYCVPPEGLRALILEHIELFVVWFEDLQGEYPDEFPADVLHLAKQIERDGVAALHATTSEQAALVDNFVMFFCVDFDNNYAFLKSASESWIKSYHYRDCRLWLEVHCSPASEKLWMFMLEGRGIERNSEQLPFEYEPHERGSIAYWTAQECIAMLHELMPLTISEAEPTFCVRIVREALQTVVDQQASMLILVN